MGVVMSLYYTSQEFDKEVDFLEVAEDVWQFYGKEDGWKDPDPKLPNLQTLIDNKGYYDLNKWMENLYRGKGGKGNPDWENKFVDCVVSLTSKDLEALFDAIIEYKLPVALPDYGTSQVGNRDDNLRAVFNAARLLEHGGTVFYSSD